MFWEERPSKVTEQWDSIEFFYSMSCLFLAVIQQGQPLTRYKQSPNSAIKIFTNVLITTSFEKWHIPFVFWFVQYLFLAAIQKELDNSSNSWRVRTTSIKNKRSRTIVDRGRRYIFPAAVCLLFVQLLAILSWFVFFAGFMASQTMSPPSPRDT